MGALYVLNPTESPLSLRINGEPMGPLRRCFAPGYRPSSTWVTITRQEEDGRPHLGENVLEVIFEADPYHAYPFPFTLAHGSFLLGEDVVAVAMRGCLLLTAQTGGRLKPNPLPILAASSHLPAHSTHNRRKI